MFTTILCSTIQNNHKQQGAALTTAMLYLAILTLLVVAALAVSSLQTKLSQQYFQAAETFENAEAALVTVEILIQPGEQQGEGVINQQVHYRFSKLTATNPCTDSYVINVMNKAATSNIQLESIWQLPIINSKNVLPEECLSEAVMAGRMAWRQIN
jgi:Tfp pilus assembly protein PilX